MYKNRFYKSPRDISGRNSTIETTGFTKNYIIPTNIFSRNTKLSEAIQVHFDVSARQIQELTVHNEDQILVIISIRLRDPLPESW